MPGSAPATTPGLRPDRCQVSGGERRMHLPTGEHRAAPWDEHEDARRTRLSYDDPTSNRYWSRLDGYDHDCLIAQGADGGRVIAGLSPGATVLRMRAVDANGNAAREQQILPHVLPPWWRTAGAYAGSRCLGALLVARAAIAYRRRPQRRAAWQLAEHKREVWPNRRRRRNALLATPVTRSVTPMTGVLGMSELLQSGHADAQQRGQVDAIRRAGDAPAAPGQRRALTLPASRAGKLELDRWISTCMTASTIVVADDCSPASAARASMPPRSTRRR